MQPSPVSSESVAGQYTAAMQALCNLSESYYYLGRLDEANKLLKISEQLLEMKEVTRYDKLQLLLQSGKIFANRIFYSRRTLEETFTTLEHAKQLATSLADKQGEADACDLLGLAHYHKQLATKEGESSTSLDYYQQALEQREALGDQRGISESSFHIGLIYTNGDQRDYELAYSYNTKAYQIARQHGYKLEQSYAIRHLGGLYFKMQGDLERARQCFEESLALREEIGFKIALPLSLLALGEICAKQNEPGAASRHYQQAEALAREMEQPVVFILAKLNLGMFYQGQQQYPQALACFEQVYRTAKDHNFADWLSVALARKEAISNEGLA